MIDFRPLLDLNFWFNLQPQALSPTFERFFFLAFGSMIIIAAVSRIVARHRKEDRYLLKIYRKLTRMFLTMGIFGMLIFFFNFEELYFFGARFWFLVWGIGLIVWIVMIVRFAKVRVPAMKEEHLRGREEERYMPRKKGRK
ncbi:hypothetical protein IH979_01420 [Patescibacteria group bacterium]|nr:hypothetical protein [Patescibacteria group bacterium]